MSVKTKRLLAGILIAIILWVFVYPIADGQGWLIFIPAAHDPRLVGEWKGTWRWGGQHHMRFRKDGTGETEGYPFWWGTDNGTLRVKRRSSGEGFSSGAATYEVDESGSTVQFHRKPTFMIPIKMSRL